MGRTSQRAWVQVVTAVRQQGRAAGLPCALCNGALGPIDYRTQREADADAEASGEWWLIGAHRPLALSVDHIVPHSAGGEDCIENAQPSHATCNARAQDKGHAAQRRKAQNKPVNGYWTPLDGKGQPLPGRAVPGTQTPTHRFVADTRGMTPAPPSRPGPLGIARTSGGIQPPKEYP